MITRTLTTTTYIKYTHLVEWVPHTQIIRTRLQDPKINFASTHGIDTHIHKHQKMRRAPFDYLE